MGRTYGDRWEVVRSLSEGGQARTFIVIDRRGDGGTPYVLKRLKNPNRAARFKQEVEAIRNLNHPGVLRLIDFDVESPEPYLVTEYCAGGTLEDSEPFWRDSPAHTLELFEQICAAVSHAHANGVIHRDLKPANIFLQAESGPPVVGDFGLCLLDGVQERVTATDEAVGPYRFMAPELEDGRLEDVSTRADIYSLGKLLYWLFSGRVFTREKHREQGWDLKGPPDESMLGRANIYLEHVNRLLDLMITADPAQRRSIDNIRALAEITRRLVEKEYYPVVKGLRHPCAYCGLGYYVKRANGSDLNAVRSMGFTPVGDPKWLIFTCNNCGHLQAFRLDYSGANGGWLEPPESR